MEKIQLSTLYGVLPDDKRVAFYDCSKNVRHCPCKKCLHFRECMAKGEPVPPVMKYLQWLQHYALPRIEYELNQITARHVRLVCRLPMGNVDKYYMYIKAQDSQHHRIFTLALTRAFDYEKLLNGVINAYIKKGITNNGKQKI